MKKKHRTKPTPSLSPSRPIPEPETPAYPTVAAAESPALATLLHGQYASGLHASTQMRTNLLRQARRPSARQSVGWGWAHCCYGLQ